jgi:hypothetical protein
MPSLKFLRENVNIVNSPVSQPLTRLGMPSIVGRTQVEVVDVSLALV